MSKKIDFAELDIEAPSQTTLEGEIRKVLTDHARALCARRVAEILTSRTGTRFGPCGPETEAVEAALRAMQDVEEDEAAYTEGDGEAYRIRRGNLK